MEWSALNYPIGTLVNEWSGRKNLVAQIGPGIVPTARYMPTKSRIEANTDVILKGVTAAEAIKKDITVNFKKFPVAIGALYHEAMHARHSGRTDLAKELDGLTEREFSVVVLFEEPRIEALGIAKDQTMKPYLKASCMRIVMAEAKDTIAKGKKFGVDNAILSLGRVSAGVLSPKNVKKIREVFVKMLDEETVEKMEAILDEVVKVEDGNFTRMAELARLWCETVEDPESEDDTPEIDEETLRALLDALGDAASSAGTEAGGEIVTQEREERKRQAEKEKAEKEVRRREAKKQGEKPMSAKRALHADSMGHGYNPHGLGVPFTTRKPTADERRAAVRLANRLAKIEYTDKHKDKVAAEVPPGRVKIRNIIQNRGREANGSRERLPEWETQKRTVTDSPTLRVGMIVDVSGSMSSAMEPMAATNYIIKAALDRIHAEVSTVYMGEDVYDGTARKHADEVQVWNANAGTEHFAGAAALLDNRLNFTLQESGARLAVIASDANYHKPGAMDAANRWLRVLRNQGVAVVWLGYAGAGAAERLCNIYGARFVPMSGSETPTEVASIVGEAAARELQSKK